MRIPALWLALAVFCGLLAAPRKPEWPNVLVVSDLYAGPTTPARPTRAIQLGHVATLDTACRTTSPHLSPSLVAPQID